MAQENENPRKKIRLTKEQKENERAVARRYTIIKVSRDEDFCKQIGSGIYFDLVDHDKVHSFRIPKQMPFNLFMLSSYCINYSPFGVPVQFQRFWLWAKRQNHTYRPDRSLTFQEETQSVEKLREECGTTHNAELNLFLEVNRGLELHPILPPDRTQEDILLFFKLYDPEKEKLRDVSFKYLLIQDIVKGSTFHASQLILMKCIPLENGDIICFQKPPPADSLTRCRYPYVPSFLEYILNRRVVHFQSLEKPKGDDFFLELNLCAFFLNINDQSRREYLMIMSRKELLGILVWMSPTKIRLTPHNYYSQQPIAQAIEYQGFDHLSEMLIHHNQESNILYYEVLDIPLPVLQALKTLNVSFRLNVIHRIRLPNKSTVGDVINDLKTKVELSHLNAELRLLKSVFPLSEKIENIKDQYFTLHAEEVSQFLYCSKFCNVRFSFLKFWSLSLFF
ncbi:hypothetical protein MKX01_034645 [Papaver californicum]|nr:hypothetical protein MKX01_034645 [Papaver californicum]